MTKNIKNNQTIVIPTSNNLSMIVDEMVKLNDFTDKFSKLVVDYAKIIKTFGKIDAKELYNNARNVNDISDGINIFMKSVGVVMVGLKNLNEGIDINDIKDLRKKLLTGESGGNTIVLKNIESKGATSLDLTKEITRAKVSEPGLIDIVAQVATLSGTMQSLQFANPIKFKIKFLQTLKLFKWQYRKLVDFSNEFDVKTIRTIKFATDGLQEVMMSLPSAVAAMASMFSSYGGLRKRIQIKGGIKALLGNKMDGTGGIVWSVLLLGEQLNEKTLNQESVESFYKTTKTLNKAIRSITRTLTLVALAGPLLKLGVFTLFGRGKGKGGRGVIGVIITGLSWIANKMKSIQKAEKSLVYIAIVILMLAAAVTLMVLTGALIVMGWKQILIVSTFMIVLIGVFMLIGLATTWIDRGAKEILYIAATVAILALTAMLIVLLGNYVEAEWQSILQVGVMLGFLIIAFSLVGLAAKFINNGVKELLIIALTVTILALIAVGLVYISNYISGNWDNILQIGVILLFICAPIIAIGLLHKQLDKGKQALIIVLVSVIILTACIWVLADIANSTDMDSLAITSAIMVGIMLTVFGMMVALAAIASSRIGAFALGIGAAIAAAIAVCMIMMGNAIKAIAEAAVLVDSLHAKNEKELTKKLELPIHAALGVIDALGELNPLALTVGAYNATQLAKTMSSIGTVAFVLQKMASLNMPDPDAGYDKNGKPQGWRQMTGQDFADAMQNANGILAVAAGMFDDDMNGKSISFADGKSAKIMVVSMDGIDKIHWATKIKVKRLSKIVGYVGNMASTLQHIASLNMPDPDKGYDENGKPLGWKQMKGTDFADAATNAGNILSFFADLFAEKPVKRNILGLSITVGMSNELAGLDNIMPRTRRKIKRLNDIVTSIGNMATTLQNVATLKIPTKFDENGKPTNWESLDADNFTKVTENVKLIAQTLIGAIASDDLSESLNSMNKKSAKNLARILESIGNINSIMDVIKQLGEDKYVKTWKIDKNGNKIPDTYGSYTVLLKKSKTIETNIKTMIGIIVNPFSQYNHGKDERNLHGAADEIKTISKVINDGSDIINGLIKIYNDDLVKFSIDDYGKRWDIQIDVVSSMLKTIGGVKINMNDAKTIANNLDKAVDLVKHINSINEVNVINLKMATGLINQTFGNANIDKNGAKTIANNIDKTNDLIKRINKVNPDNLKTATKLMEHISKLSESIRGDFDGLAKAINENLLKALEKLTKALDDINEKEFNVHKESNVSTIGGAIAPSGSAGVKDKQQQIKQAQQPQTNKNILTKKDIADLKSSIDAIRNIFDGIVTTDRKVQVKI